MATQIEAFRLVAPEFSSSSDEVIQSFLDLAVLFIEPMKYSEDVRGLAIVYQAASLMYKQKQSSSGQSSGLDLTMEKEGDLQRSYGKSSSSTNGMTKDIYQQQLDMLAKSFAGSTIMTRYGI